MSTSFTEKSVWIQLIALMGTFAAYALIAGYFMRQGQTEMAPYAVLMGVAVVMHVLILIVGHIAAAIYATLRGEDADTLEMVDERDKVIEWRAEASSAWIVGFGVILTLGALVFDLPRLWIVHLLVTALYASEALKYALQLRWYRLGMRLGKA